MLANHSNANEDSQQLIIEYELPNCYSQNIFFCEKQNYDLF